VNPAEVSPDVKQQRMKEFMSLLPLTIELAGLPRSSTDRLFSTDQMEARVITIRLAYKLARNMVREVGDQGI
jgi:hypothetical protein